MLKARSKRAISIFLLSAASCLLPLSCENPFIQKILEYKTVSFNTNGGSSVPDQNLIKGWKITRPDDPVKDGAVFEGWYLDNFSFEVEWDFDIVPDRDITLYAKWSDDGRIQITFAAVTVTAPETDQIPADGAEVDAEGGANYSITAVSWSPAHNPFLQDTRYTVSVTLAADEGYTFRGLTDARINGEPAGISDNPGSTVTLSLTFEPTAEIFVEFDLQTAVNAYQSAMKDTVIRVPGNLNLTKNITVPANTNGYTLTISSNRDSPYNIHRGQQDTNDNSGLFIVQSGAKLIFENIVINGNKETHTKNAASLVRVNSGGEFTLNKGAVLKNNLANNGGGVYVDGGDIAASTFTMIGGEVSGNQAAGNGGGVYVFGFAATFIMNGGNVGGTGSGKGNTANGGGGGVYVDSTGTFKMEGGEVSGNEALVGGGVSLSEGTFNMSGGEVSGNTATLYGGGIFLSGFGGNNTFYMSGGVIVAANNDVYLLESRQITVTGALTGTAPVATITPSSYSKGREVVVLGTGATGTTLAQASTKFAVKPNGSDNDWSVDGEGKLATVDMKSVTGGSFQMGNTAGGGKSNELPVHTVTLTQGFSISKYQVTQEQYQTVMTGNTNGINAAPSSFKTAADDGEIQNRRPVENVSWYEALVFCNRLSIAEGLTPAYRISNSTDPSVWGIVPEAPDSTWSAVEMVAGSTGYRLPTEAQWEYAAKGGPSASTPYKVYSGSNTIDDVAWWGNADGSSGNSWGKTHEVGLKAPNELAVYDMSGNVWEWCWDRFGSYPNPSSPQTDPVGPSSGTDRVIRGGGWKQPEAEVRSEARGDEIPPSLRAPDIGFRVLRPVQ